jgi:hypothetical protein
VRSAREAVLDQLVYGAIHPVGREPLADVVYEDRWGEPTAIS